MDRLRPLRPLVVADAATIVLATVLAMMCQLVVVWQPS
jgi:hypothetical protein